MWNYDQKSGKMLPPGSTTPVEGYSGFGQGKNNPSMQDVPDVGPIPIGCYTIGDPFDDPEKGPCVISLTPQPGTDTFDRSGFLIHGDSIEHPGQASHGCIIMPRFLREMIARSADRELTVE